MYASHSLFSFFLYRSFILIILIISFHFIFLSHFIFIFIFSFISLSFSFIYFPFSLSHPLACCWVVPFVACGRHSDLNFLVMELLGDNIAELRRLQQGHFSMNTTIKLGIQMIKAIESVHNLGYIHRDIKPSNFAMGLSGIKKQTCFLIDFGLARRYMLPDGEIRPPRDCAGFRGTARYASINSHQSRDLGRRDDLWSVLYLLIEFSLGQLPWRRLRDKDKVGEMKVRYNNDELVAGLPQEFLLFMRHLSTLQYHSRPDYLYLVKMFEELYTKLGGNEKTIFDWEMLQVFLLSFFFSFIHFFPILDAACIPHQTFTFSLELSPDTSTLCHFPSLSSLFHSSFFSLFLHLCKFRSSFVLPFPYLCFYFSFFHSFFFQVMKNFDDIYSGTATSILLKIPLKIRKRMIDYLLRLREGKLPFKEKLLDTTMRDMDLSRAHLHFNELLSISKLCSNLRSLKLGCSFFLVLSLPPSSPPPPPSFYLYISSCLFLSLSLERAIDLSLSFFHSLFVALSLFIWLSLFIYIYLFFSVYFFSSYIRIEFSLTQLTLFSVDSRLHEWNSEEFRRTESDPRRNTTGIHSYLRQRTQARLRLYGHSLFHAGGQRQSIRQGSGVPPQELPQPVHHRLPQL